MQPREQDIITCVLNGRTSEFAYFLDTYGDRVFALIAGIVPSEQDAEELMQDTFVRAFQRLGSFKGDAKFSTWLYRIACNLAVSFLRSRGPQTDVLQEGWMNLDDDDVDAFFGDDSDPRLALLDTALLRLPPEERTVITLFYFEEKSLAEIAYITLGDATKVSTVSSQLCRLRKKLYGIIKQLEG